MVQVVLLIFALSFSLFGFSCAKLYYLEMRIMKRLQTVNHSEWQTLIWWFGSRAHPFRFRRYIKSGDFSDPVIKEYVQQYQRTRRFASIAWLLMLVVLAFFTIAAIAMHY